MRVLLTNDDGIFAPGIKALGEAFRGAGCHVSVCAPDRERSAASHSATFTPLHARSVALDWADQAWVVDGTPADCASLGLFLTREAPVDLVVSGINRGMNLGGACVYSGTVGAALEAAMSGCQGLAVSLCFDPERPETEDYAAAARIAVKVAEWAVRHPLPLGVMYNLNVPPLPYGQIRGIVPAALAPVFLMPPDYRLVEDEEGAGYRYQGRPQRFERPDYDTVQIDAGYATLTRLTWDFRLNADDSELGEISL